MQGTIKKIIGTRGFGFIAVEGQEDDIFFHSSNIKNVEFEELKEGDVVEFEIEDTFKGPNAINVEVVQ